MSSLQLTLRLIGLAAFGSMASMRICDPMLVALGQDFQVSTGEASRVIASFAVAYGTLQLFYGPLGDRLGKVRVIVLATCACSLFSAITALAPTLDTLVLSRAFMGASAAGIIPLSMAWIGDQVSYDKRQETLGRFMGATVTGMMAGQWFGGVAAEHLGWRWAFAVLAVIFFLAAVTLARKTGALRRGSVHGGQGGAVSLAQSVRNSVALLRIPRVRWVLGVTAVEGALAFGTLAFVPSRLVSAFGFSASAAGGVMILYGVGGLLYSQFVSRWLRLLGERGLALTGGTLMAVALAALAWVPVAEVAVGACFLAGLGFYMLHNTLQTQATQMAPHARGSAVTLFACLLFLGQSLGVLLVAWSVDRGGLSMALGGAGLALLALAAWVSRRVAPRAAPQVA
ncbi:MFS transporter [Curvibacter sp. HBC61]|uniref:MFS transporter n=1 Tax=Curvibacter cyanobacteriorum TaxID=3026422 RepID=A0ABT5MU75_9BURK|nr:MFS transporter [Curvibacter sp. HBC61]MDD0837604.1 MFS transporter [Curvibacter sp. HBC61]